MKLSNWAIFIAAILLVFFVFMRLNMKATKKQVTVTKELTQGMSESMYDASSTSSWKLTDADVRETFIDTFSGSLSIALGWDITSDLREEMMRKIPVIAVADVDGYWLYYTEVCHDGEYSFFTKVMSTKTAYFSTYGSYSVKMSFDGNVEVMSSTSTDTVEGRYEEVYESLKNKPGTDGLSFMADKESFDAECSYVASKMITGTLTKYVNEHMYGNGEYTYAFDIPQADREVRTITGPCVLALYQGQTVKISTGWVDIYSMIAGDLTEKRLYEVRETIENGVSVMYFHDPECPYCEGEVLFRGTVEECALMGAVHCPHE